jgi:hypothetical protein
MILLNGMSDPENRVQTILHSKDRLDSLLSYQKELHEIPNRHANPELGIRAISELHRIGL